jgi:hypothetical protein
MENIDIVFKVITLIIAVFGLPRIIEELTNTKRSRLREEFKFIKEFITELESAHPFVIEKGYLAISGDDSLTAKEIIYLFSLKSPGQALRKYARARKYLKFQEPTDSTEAKIEFREEYPGNKRKWLKKINIGAYGIFASFAFAPLLFAKDIFGSNWQLAIALSGLFLVGFGALAYSFLADYARILRGEELILMQ